MSRKDREDLEAWLAADPELRAAWNEFTGSLDRASQRFDKASLAELRHAAMRVRQMSGEDQTRH